MLLPRSSWFRLRKKSTRVLNQLALFTIVHKDVLLEMQGLSQMAVSRTRYVAALVLSLSSD